MKYKKALILSRYHDDIANPIYNAYIRGIESQVEVFHFIDYFDQLSALGKNGFEEQILNILEKENIDLIFTIFVSGDPILDPYFLQKIAKYRFMVMVFWDSEQFYEQIDRYYAQLADLVILPANYEYVNKLKMIGVNAICPFSLFDSTKYKPLENNITESIDVSFVGEVTKGKRQEYIQYLLEHGINIESFGAGTKNGKVSFEKVVEIFNSTKVNLSFTGTYDSSIYTYCLNINNRIKQNKGKPIEIALCGGFVLTEHVPGIEKVFPDKSIDTFLSKEELLQKIKFYLKNDSLRHEMKKKSYKNAVKNYDSIIAFKKIFETIKHIKPKTNKKLILDNIFIKINNTFHIFYFIAFLAQKRYKLSWDEIRIFMKNPIFLYKDLIAHIYYYILSIKMKIKFNKNIYKILKLLKNKNVVIYGTGIHTINLFKKFPKLKKLNIKAVTNSFSKHENNTFLNYPIIEPKEIPDYGNYVIISSFVFQKEIKQYILSLNMPNIKIIELYNSKITRDTLSSKDYQRIDPYQIYRNTLKLR